MPNDGMPEVEGKSDSRDGRSHRADTEPEFSGYLRVPLAPGKETTQQPLSVLVRNSAPGDRLGLGAADRHHLGHDTGQLSGDVDRRVRPDAIESLDEIDDVTADVTGPETVPFGALALE